MLTIAAGIVLGIFGFIVICRLLIGLNDWIAERSWQRADKKAADREAYQEEVLRKRSLRLKPKPEIMPGNKPTYQNGGLLFLSCQSILDA